MTLPTERIFRSYHRIDPHKSPEWDLLYQFVEWVAAEERRANRFSRAIFYNEPQDQKLAKRFVRRFFREHGS